MARQAEAEWKGDLKGGTGRVKTGSGGYDGNYSFATRFENGAGANPEELLGAARVEIARGHAACRCDEVVQRPDPPDRLPELRHPAQNRRVDDRVVERERDLEDAQDRDEDESGEPGGGR